MHVYTQFDLEKMLAGMASDLVGRKESFEGDIPSKAREAVRAFANDLPARQRPGVLFIGARDDGSRGAPASAVAMTDPKEDHPINA